MQRAGTAKTCCHYRKQQKCGVSKASNVAADKVIASAQSR